MIERTKPDLTAELHRTLNNACRKWGAREIRLRYLPKPSLNRWIAEALIDHHRVIEKIRTDIPSGELTLQDMETFNDQPIARGVGDTATDAIKTMLPLESAEKWVRASLFPTRIDCRGRRDAAALNDGPLWSSISIGSKNPDIPGRRYPPSSSPHCAEK
jgi:hypothetical protein